MLVQLFQIMPFIAKFCLKLEILLSYWCFVNEKAHCLLFSCYLVISVTVTLKLVHCFL